MIKKGDIIRLSQEYQGPRDRKGGIAFKLYKVAEVNEAGVVAYNVGTCEKCELRLDTIEWITSDQDIQVSLEELIYENNVKKSLEF